MKYLLQTYAVICLLVGPLQGQSGVSTYHVPQGLVRGAAFIDRFLPVPLQGELRSDVWGAEQVIPRDVNNGIEDDEYSYWGATSSRVLMAKSTCLSVAPRTGFIGSGRRARPTIRAS